MEKHIWILANANQKFCKAFEAANEIDAIAFCEPWMKPGLGWRQIGSNTWHLLDEKGVAWHQLFRYSLAQAPQVNQRSAAA